MPAGHLNLSDELLAFEEVSDDALGLTGALLVPGIGEQAGAISGHQHAATESLPRRVVEPKRAEPLPQRLPVLLLVELDLDPPLVGVAWMLEPLAHRANVTERALPRRLVPAPYHSPTVRIDDILTTTYPCFSVEYFPPKTDEGRATLFETVEVLRELEPAYFSVTYGAGGATREGTLETTRAIRDEYGVEAMAHLSCVGETTESLREIIERIADAGIENILALRGDPPRGQPDFVQPEGGLGSAAELTGLISDTHPQIAIGGACFPEVHPEAPTLEADIAYLKTKVDNGASFLITQLFFDNRSYFDFIPAARAAGIEVPIIAGVMPITGYKQIARICDLCDAKIPPDLAAAMEALDGDERAEFELGVAYAAQQCAELLAGGAPGIHFYALNKWPATRAILAALRAARPWERASGEAAAIGTP